MKVYIETKTGNYNVIGDFPGIGTLQGVLKAIRIEGGFYSKNRQNNVIYVPFEEVEYVSKPK